MFSYSSLITPPTQLKLTIHSALLSQNFTEFGWGLTKAPKAIVDKLKKQLHAGLKIMEEKEKNDPREPHERESFFIPNDEINNDIVHELLPLHEAWSGVELVPQNTYGLRVYRGDTNLNMHVDITETHVISSILHVDHSDDEPWPIVIEDFHGNTNEVFLESGDMLFYESSKCMHGRPSKFNGAYYSSVFTHYYPVGWNDDGQLYNNLYARIPKSWNDRSKKIKNATEHGITDGSSIVEPECEHEWCALRESLKWHGPAPGYGKVLSGDGKVTNLMNIPSERSFDRKKSMNPGTSAEVYVQGSDDF